MTSIPSVNLTPWISFGPDRPRKPQVHRACAAASLRLLNRAPNQDPAWRVYCRYGRAVESLSRHPATGNGGKGEAPTKTRHIKLASRRVHLRPGPPTRVAGVGWSRAQLVRIIALEYSFEPNRLVLRRNIASRLHLENHG